MCRWSLRTRIGTISMFSPCQITLCRAFALSPPHWLRWSLYWAISFPTIFPCTWILLKLLFLLSITRGHQEQIFPLCVCVCVCWCGSVHRCNHAEMYVLAISVLNNSATPALFASILSKLEQPISFSLSQTLPRFKCLALSSSFLVSWIIHLMLRGLRWPHLPYVYPSRKKCFSLHWAWWLWHLFRLTPPCQVIIRKKPLRTQITAVNHRRLDLRS